MHRQIPGDQIVIRNDVRWVDHEIINLILGFCDDQVQGSTCLMCWLTMYMLNAVKTGENIQEMFSRIVPRSFHVNVEISCNQDLALQ